MKITQENPNMLILENKNLLAIFIGVLFVVFGIISFFLSFKQNIFVALFFILFGGLAIFFWKAIKIVFDKTQGQIFISTKGIFGAKEENYNFSDIKEVSFREWEEYEIVKDEHSYQPRRMVQHNLSLITNDDKEIVISSGGKSGSIFIFGKFFAGQRPKTKEEEIAEKIASFLNVPLNKHEGEKNPLSQIFKGGDNQNTPPSVPPQQSNF
jgi:hypothetical protein